MVVYLIHYSSSSSGWLYICKHHSSCGLDGFITVNTTPAVVWMAVLCLMQIPPTVASQELSSHDFSQFFNTVLLLSACTTLHTHLDEVQVVEEAGALHHSTVF